MKTFILKSFLTVLFAVLSSAAFTQAPPAPTNNADGSLVGGTPLGGGAAPLGAGITLMLSLGAAYGTRKIYHFRCKEK